MKLTKFRQLRQAISQLDRNLIGSRIAEIDRHLQQDGLKFEPQNTAITEEGIYYIEPDSGMATKVLAYRGDFEVNLGWAQRRKLPDNGFEDRATISAFHPYHLLRCNTLTQDAKLGALSQYTVTKRMTGRFTTRIVGALTAKSKKREIEVYREYPEQQLYVCEFCLMKVCVLIEGMRGKEREKFDPKQFFNVDSTRSWNSRGRLAKDHGFMNDLYPKDWEDICAIRKEQVAHHCERCNTDLSDPLMQKYLQVSSTDHVKGKEGYIKLVCLCLACLSEEPAYEHLKDLPELHQYLRELRSMGMTHTSSNRNEDQRSEKPKKPAKDFAKERGDSGQNFGAGFSLDD